MFGLANPTRALIVHGTKPLNAEPPLDRLRGDFLTDVANFYIRSHGDMPNLDSATHKVRVTGQVARPFDFTVGDLKVAFSPGRSWPCCSAPAIAGPTCSPSRRTTGDPWAPGAIGNAEWTGVALSDVLQAAGASGDGLHVAFEGADIVENDGAEDAPYGVSIPIVKARVGRRPPRLGDERPAVVAGAWRAVAGRRPGLRRGQEHQVVARDPGPGSAVRGLPAGARLPAVPARHARGDTGPVAWRDDQ